MSKGNAFYLAPHEYKRDLDLKNQCVMDYARNLSIMEGAPMEECIEFAKKMLAKGGEFEFKDPPVLHTQRGDNGDRRLVTDNTLFGYISSAIEERAIIAPNMVTYFHPKVKKSLLVEFIDDNVAARYVAKKKSQSAKMAGDMINYTIFDNEQTNRKLANNSISGAHLSAGQPLYNPSAHTTLTSNCRSTSAFGNANNEKLLAGNRHYWSKDIVINNIISIVNRTDYEKLAEVMARFKLRHPSAEETMECVTYSTRLYWQSEPMEQEILALINKLTPEQRSAFVYTGDLYHICKINPERVRDFLGRMAKHIPVEHPDAEAVIKNADGALVEAACQVCEVEMRGKELKKIVGTKEYKIVASVVVNMQQVIDEYFDFIRIFFVTENVPASLAWFPSSIRRSALISDTDSTIFTVQDWIKWYFGEYRVDPESNAVGAILVFMSSQTIIHILARMSANFGVEPERIHQIAMKNEYKFDVIVPTQQAKHYFALKGCQEGNLFAEYEKEIKGVHLKSSNAPQVVIKAAEKMMLKILYDTIGGKKIKIRELLKEVGDIEREIEKTILSGDPAYFRRGQIQNADSYKKEPDKSPYQQYIMWNEVFAPTYGTVPHPPYTCVNITTDADTPAKTREWLDGLEDREFAKRMDDWLKRNNKKYVGSLKLPEAILQSRGLPKEILPIVGTRKIIRNATSVFYLIMEALNYFILDDPKRTTRLIMDYH